MNCPKCGKFLHKTLIDKETSGLERIEMNPDKFIDTFFQENPVKYQAWLLRDGNGILFGVNTEVVVNHIQTSGARTKKEFAQALRLLKGTKG